MDKFGYQILPPSTLLNPTPVVLVSCADPEKPENRNMITVAWAGTVNSDPPMISVSIRKERYSHGLISASGEFVVNLVDEKMARSVDFCGVKSGRDTDKAKETGLSYIPAEGMRLKPSPGKSKAGCIQSWPLSETGRSNGIFRLVCCQGRCTEPENERLPLILLPVRTEN